MDADGTSSCMRLRIRRNVDFPQPDGPISAVTWPAGIVSETFCRTLWSPNQALIPSARSSLAVPEPRIAARAVSEVDALRRPGTGPASLPGRTGVRSTAVSVEVAITVLVLRSDSVGG